jgi:hypothetical protein
MAQVQQALAVALLELAALLTTAAAAGLDPQAQAELADLAW